MFVRTGHDCQSDNICIHMREKTSRCNPKGFPKRLNTQREMFLQN